MGHTKPRRTAIPWTSGGLLPSSALLFPAGQARLGVSGRSFSGFGSLPRSGGSSSAGARAAPLRCPLRRAAVSQATARAHPSRRFSSSALASWALLVWPTSGPNVRKRGRMNKPNLSTQWRGFDGAKPLGATSVRTPTFLGEPRGGSSPLIRIIKNKQSAGTGGSRRSGIPSRGTTMRRDEQEDGFEGAADPRADDALTARREPSPRARRGSRRRSPGRSSSLGVASSRCTQKVGQSSIP